MDPILSNIVPRPMGHRWKFYRVGGVDQVAFRTGQDVIHLEELDQKLWVALACPAKLLEFDTRTLDLLDSDRDGRLRAPEIIEVTRWVREVFKDPEDLVAGGDSLQLSAINEEHPA
ncbi:MAG TPA: hypothetical protein VK633_13665, partial [Verrucomicrobiae bacterium]|nr:hypothetical protein [Verrucomicrobiae bacterium]